MTWNDAAPPTHALVPALTLTEYAGFACLQMHNVHGRVLIALQGGQILSWVPAGQRDVVWLSSRLRPAPAAVRGGIPVCWPWFGKQGMPQGAMQHGPVRNAVWKAIASSESRNGTLSVTLAPDRAAPGGALVDHYAPQLDLQLTIELGPVLRMDLRTHNLGPRPFALTQALHTYLAVGDAERVEIRGLDGLRFDSRVDGSRGNMHVGDFKLLQCCDNTYLHADSANEHLYVLQDPTWQRQITLNTQGSQSLVVWNPGATGAASMEDVADSAWKDFLCVEAANAGEDVVTLAPGAHHLLQQTLHCQHWPTTGTDKI